MSGPASAPSLSLESECEVSVERTKSAGWNCLTPAWSGGVTQAGTLLFARDDMTNCAVHQKYELLVASAAVLAFVAWIEFERLDIT